ASSAFRVSRRAAPYRAFMNGRAVASNSARGSPATTLLIERERSPPQVHSRITGNFSALPIVASVREPTPSRSVGSPVSQGGKDMKKCPIAAAGLAAATLAFGLGTAHAALAQSNDAQAAPRLLEHPTHITRPGAYVLRRNIGSEGPGAAITIAASNVSLDLNGFSLLGPGGKQGIGVLVDGVVN